MSNAARRFSAAAVNVASKVVRSARETVVGAVTRKIPTSTENAHALAAASMKVLAEASRQDIEESKLRRLRIYHQFANENADAYKHGDSESDRDSSSAECGEDNYLDIWNMKVEEISDDLSIDLASSSISASSASVANIKISSDSNSSSSSSSSSSGSGSADEGAENRAPTPARGVTTHRAASNAGARGNGNFGVRTFKAASARCGVMQRLVKRIWRGDEILVTVDLNEVNKKMELLVKQVYCQRRLLKTSAMEEFDEQWGIDPAGEFVQADSGVLSCLRGQRGAEAQIRAELVVVHEEVARKKSKLDVATDAHAGLEVLHLFIMDLLGRYTPAARIFETKSEEDFRHTKVVTLQSKYLAIAALIALNAFFIYFSILVGFRKGVDWQQRYLVACIVQFAVEIVLFETMECVWINCVVPALVSEEVRTVGESIKHVVYELCNTKDQDPQMFLNAPDFLFVSTNLAKKFPHLMESLLVQSYYSPVPGELSKAWQVGSIARIRRHGRMRGFALLSGVLFFFQYLGTAPFIVHRMFIRFTQPFVFSGLALFFTFMMSNPYYATTVFGICLGLISYYVIRRYCAGVSDTSSRPGSAERVTPGIAELEPEPDCYGNDSLANDSYRQQGVKPIPLSQRNQAGPLHFPAAATEGVHGWTPSSRSPSKRLKQRGSVLNNVAMLVSDVRFSQADVQQSSDESKAFEDSDSCAERGSGGDNGVGGSNSSSELASLHESSSDESSVGMNEESACALSPASISAQTGAIWRRQEGAISTAFRPKCYTEESSNSDGKNVVRVDHLSSSSNYSSIDSSSLQSATEVDLSIKDVVSEEPGGGSSGTATTPQSDTASITKQQRSRGTARTHREAPFSSIVPTGTRPSSTHRFSPGSGSGSGSGSGASSDVDELASVSSASVSTSDSEGVDPGSGPVRRGPAGLSPLGSLARMPLPTDVAGTFSRERSYNHRRRHQHHPHSQQKQQEKQEQQEQQPQ